MDIKENKEAAPVGPLPVVVDTEVVTPVVMEQKNDVNEFEKNEIVWVKQGKFDWWPAYILNPEPSQGKYKVCFGYDDVRTFAQITSKFLIKFTSPEQYNDLPDFTKKNKKSSNKQPSKKLTKSITKATYDYSVWLREKDHERHCICQQFDDGAFMYGCTNCKTCWFHPECMGLAVTEAQKADPTLIPRFKCPFVTREPYCEECVGIHHKDMEEKKRKSMEMSRKRKLQKELKVSSKKSRKDDLGSFIAADPEVTESDTESDEGQFLFSQ